MPRRATPLTAARTRNANPSDFPLGDSDGLHLIRRSGRLHWRWKYTRPYGRENRLALGAVPAIGLKDARGLRGAARLKLAKGIDPSTERIAARIAAKRQHTDTCVHFAEKRLAAQSKGR